MRTAQRRRGEEGFTLVEAMIAIIILMVGLVAVANLNLVAIGSNSLANQMTAASDVAADRLELLKDIPFDNAALNQGGSLDVYDTANANRREVDVPRVGAIYVAWQITVLDQDTKFIAVRAESPGVFGKTRSRAEFTTFRTCTTPSSGCP
jgi:Tfp pilus assembly protein PilV